MYCVPGVKYLNVALVLLFGLMVCFDPPFSSSCTSYFPTPPDGSFHETVIDLSVTVAPRIVAAFGSEADIHQQHFEVHTKHQSLNFHLYHITRYERVLALLFVSVDKC